MVRKLDEAIRREFKEGDKLGEVKRECTSHSLHMFLFQMKTLADNLTETGDSEKALRIYNEMIPVAERVFEESESVLVYLTYRGKALRLLRKNDQALELLQHVLGKREMLYGERDVRKLRDKSQIATVYFDKEHLKALRIWEELEIGCGNALADTHPDTVEVRENISIFKALLARRGRPHCRMV